MRYDYHIIVIGAGSGGLVVASGAASLGARVALIEAEKMGGDCLNAGCVPSKTFLKSAHIAKAIRDASMYGLTANLKKVDLAAVMDRVNKVIREIEPHDSRERYEGLGVDVILGFGEIQDRHTVKIGRETITGKYIVIATGSEPAVPPIPGLNEVDYQTNRTIFHLKELPGHLIVLGSGPIGIELGQGFRHLGSQVTIINRSPGLFKKDDPEVGPLMEKQLKDDGIELLLGIAYRRVRQDIDGISVEIEQEGKSRVITGDQLLVAAGRLPATKNLGLDKVGVRVDEKGYIVTNRKLKTSVKNIYACGDVTGHYQFTHMAGYQAGTIIRNIIFRLGAKADYSTVPWTTYTKPEVAHVGYTEPMAREAGIYNSSLKVALSAIDRAKAEDDRVGFLKLNLGKKGRIIGATLVGEKAGEMIPAITIAIKQKLTAGFFMHMIFSYPTESEILKSASLEAAKQSLKPWMKKVIRAVLLR
ncbi:FAD-dependent oxidoreductase [Candidatus Kuenenia sp.]|uniref:dihydrolipoyl dehydrogenase family protein n=1 Tax=Candidatus Kuenenia sp. TaxID=2499824 RepID=UPI00321F9123